MSSSTPPVKSQSFNARLVRALVVLFKIAFAGIFVFSGVNHFLHPEVYLQIMPPYLPLHRELVYVSGAFEVALGILLLAPKTSRFAAWGLIALLVAVFPANIFMATHPEQYPDLYPFLLWLRLPLQGVLVAWAWAYTRARRGPSGTNGTNGLAF
jgi:uncharacterized membrane protein